MKTISKLFMPVLFLFGTALLAGCEDSKPPIDESEPENPTLFEYVLTVVDDTTGQPRAEESVTIKRTNKAGDVVHSSTDYTTDADGVITMNVRSGYYVAEAAFEPGGKKDVIHKFEIANHLLKSTMHLKDPNPDIYPHQSVITVRNAKTGSVWAQKEFQLYSVAAGAATHVGTYTTGADGKWTGELLSGLYRIACRFDDNLPEMTATTADFSIKRDMPNTGEIDVLPCSSGTTSAGSKPIGASSSSTDSWPKSCRGMRASILLRPTPPPSANSSGPALKIRSTSPSAIRKAT